MDLDFSSEFVELFKEVVIDVWHQKRQDALNEAQVQGRRVLELEAEKQSIIQTMKSLSKIEALKVFEDDLERVSVELELTRKQRNTQEQKELDIEELVNYAGYLMARVNVLLVDTDNSEQQRMLFNLVFDEMPNYDEIVNRTVKLSRSFALNTKPALSKSQLVSVYRKIRTQFRLQR